MQVEVHERQWSDRIGRDKDTKKKEERVAENQKRIDISKLI